MITNYLLFLFFFKFNRSGTFSWTNDISKKDILLSTAELFSLSPVSAKPAELSFTTPDLSSQGGLLLLREYEQQRGFIHSLSVWNLQNSS